MPIRLSPLAGQQGTSERNTWVVVVILAIILLAAIVHWADGGALNLKLGHFVLNVGFT